MCHFLVVTWQGAPDVRASKAWVGEFDLSAERNRGASATDSTANFRRV